MYFLKHITVSTIICLAICFFSCSNKPANLIKQDKMKLVLFHVMMVDEYLNHYLLDDSLNTRDSIRAQMYIDVLNLHHTDTLSFSESLAYYKRNVKEFRELIDSVNSYATRERERRIDSISRVTTDSLTKAAKIDSLRNAALTDSLNKVAKADSLKIAAKADSLKNAKRTDSLKIVARVDSLKNARRVDSLRKAAKADSLKKAVKPKK